MDNQVFSSVFSNVVLRNHIFKMMKHIHSDVYKSVGYKWDSVKETPTLLATHNYFEMLKDLLYQMINAKKKWFHFAIGGQLEKKDVELLNSTLAATIVADRFEIFQYILEQYNNFALKSSSTNLMELAVKHGRLEMAKYIDHWYDPKSHNTFFKYNQLVVLAADSQNVELLKWIITVKIFSIYYSKPEIKDVIWAALRKSLMNARFDMVKYLMGLAGNFDIDFQEIHDKLLVAAAASGNIPIIEWLQTKGFLMDDQTEYSMTAAYHGHLELVKYLIKHRLTKLTTRTMDYSTASGNLELVKWLHNNCTQGCTTVALDTAMAFNQQEIVQWLKNNRTEGSSPIESGVSALQIHHTN
ncbi:hypothetical protein PPL_09928 [Heterostelium album PN500]|uniref:Ankyrin repeat protein n=1 Tax=Heterostelium pallidum (strain ATCC 26659 / Pp 5 / PN500) TaxID=670386 RepID=D3BPR1_HETP5|nr:hypothetical protein PPL_09928 [Heterostelium album PN500]EFA76623.1 hypothetical protein PPL_09928 [Heterostelium album PN500]|eukprot:XP_020428755.1 hypothetical protein PPL_09928 [Heterostelium album PN500]